MPILSKRKYLYQNNDICSKNIDTSMYVFAIPTILKVTLCHSGSGLDGKVSCGYTRRLSKFSRWTKLYIIFSNLITIAFKGISAHYFFLSLTHVQHINKKYWYKILFFMFLSKNHTLKHNNEQYYLSKYCLIRFNIHLNLKKNIFLKSNNKI